MHILWGLPLCSTPSWHLWVTTAPDLFVPESCWGFWSNGWRPAGPLHCPSSAVCSHSHLSCCSVVYARASLHDPFAPSGLAVTDCVLSIKCSWALHSPLVPRVTPAWKERDESEMTTLFKAVADGHRTKWPCHTLGRALLPGDSAPWRQAASCFWVSDRFCFVLFLIEWEVFYSVPDDMKSIHLKIWGRPWGLPAQRKIPIMD